MYRDHIKRIRRSIISSNVSAILLSILSIAVTSLCVFTAVNSYASSKLIFVANVIFAIVNIIIMFCAIHNAIKFRKAMYNIIKQYEELENINRIGDILQCKKSV